MKQLAEQLKTIIEKTFPLLLSVTEEESNLPLGEGKWSRKELLGHLIDSAANNHQRFIRAQFSADLRLPGYTQEQWVTANGYSDEAWCDVVQLWKLYNFHLAHVLSRLPEEALLSAVTLDDKPPVTLRFIAEDYVRHILHHLKQMNITPAG